MRVVLLGLAVVGVALVALWIATRSSESLGGSDGPRGYSDTLPEFGGDAAPCLQGLGTANDGTAQATYGPGIPPESAPTWLPENVDVRFPEQADAFLVSLLDEEKVDWNRVGDVLAASPGPFSDATRRRLLGAVVGEDRAAAARAVIRMRSGSLVPCLLALYDDERHEDGVRAGVLGVLVELEGADADRVSEALAARLRHEPRWDRGLLDALARRGGAVAASALVEYLRWSRAQEPPIVLAMPDLDLDLIEDVAARRALLAEIARESNPDVHEALLRAAGQRGAFAVAGALIAMDHADLPEQVQAARLASLAEIGGDDVVFYLLGRAEREDPLTQRALQALAHVSTAGERGREAIREALARSLAEQQAEQQAEQEKAERFLRLLGRLRDPYAAPLMARCLRVSGPRMRMVAVNGLSRLGRHARGQVPALVQAYEGAEGDEVLQREVVRALGHIGGVRVSDFLLRLSKEEDLAEDLQRVLEAALVNARDG